MKPADMLHTASAAESTPAAAFEIIDSATLAERWNLPESWVRSQVRSRATDPIPHLQFGRYIRFRWNSPELNDWLNRRLTGQGK